MTFICQLASIFKMFITTSYSSMDILKSTHSILIFRHLGFLPILFIINNLAKTVLVFWAARSRDRLGLKKQKMSLLGDLSSSQTQWEVWRPKFVHRASIKIARLYRLARVVTPH